MTDRLRGTHVLVTRPADGAGELADRLRTVGAVPVVAPSIEIVPARSSALTRAVRDLDAGRFAWLVLTSRSTVDMLRTRITSPGFAAQVATIGEGTSEAFRRWTGRSPDLTPTTFTTSALARAFPRGSGRVLCARADIAPAGLEDALAAKGWSAERVDAYRTRLVRSLPALAARELREGAIHAITFTSASTVRGFVGAVDVVRGNPKVVCIGSVTAREARGRGLRVSTVARPHTLDGLIDALERAFAPRVSTTRQGPRTR